MPKQNTRKKLSIAVVGGGMTGIAASMKLAGSGMFDVTLFEKADTLGGLSSSYTWEDVTWDRYYHVVLSTDTVMLDFINELKLTDQLFWKETRSGFYGRDRLVPMSSTFDFVKFPFMSIWQKFRMGLGILYSSSINDPSKLDRLYVREWLTRVFGRRVYENIWEPLLRSKLGDAREKTSAAFIWATINRLYGARDAGGSKKERMGHVYGGYHTILRAAERELNNRSVLVRKSCPVEYIDYRDEDLAGQKTGSKRRLTLFSGGIKYDFDKVLLTANCSEVLRMINQRLTMEGEYWQQLRKVNYLGVICVLLFVRYSLSPYYVINLLDKDLPFTGIIEATNVVPPKFLRGKHIVYLPKYVTKNDPLINRTDGEIIEFFIKNLKKVFPSLNDCAILHKRIFRSDCVQPLQELNTLNRTIGFKTPLPGVYLANTSMICNSTLNNNAAISLSHQITGKIINESCSQ